MVLKYYHKGVNMKKYIYVIAIVLILLVLVGCQSKSQQANNEEDVTKGEVQDFSDVPDFYLNPPQADDKIYGVGVAKTQRLDLSKKLALSRARDDIAFQISAQVQSTINDYAQEGGESSNSQLITFIETVSRQIADTTLAGTTTEKIANSKDGTIYALVSFPKANILKAASEVFQRNEDAAFAEFKAREAFDRLDQQLNNNPTTSRPITE